MVSNAKSFNQKTSQIYSDAEKVRKLVSNFMVERNPAYQDKNYQAVATPIPASWDPKSRRDSTHVRPTSEEVKSEQTPSHINGQRPSRNTTHPSVEHDSQRASSTPATQDIEDDTGESFEGNTFQQAQAKIVRELMELKDEE